MFRLSRDIFSVKSDVNHRTMASGSDAGFCVKSIVSIAPLEMRSEGACAHMCDIGTITSLASNAPRISSGTLMTRKKTNSLALTIFSGETKAGPLCHTVRSNVPRIGCGTSAEYDATLKASRGGVQCSVLPAQS
jgi:hypothetical protein